MIIWFSGLSGSGKSTLGKLLVERIGKSYLIDGDELRKGLCNNLGYSEVDRGENMRRASELGKILVELGYVVVVALISPIEADRSMVREIIGKDLIEVYLSTSLGICEGRDVKGLYRRARNGEIRGFTGIDGRYEVPYRSDIILDTGLEGIGECVEKIYELYKRRQKKG